MDVLMKEGLLFLQGVKFGKKIWRKIWVKVFNPSQAGVGRIELYDVREDAVVSMKLKKAEKRVIRFAECLSVTPALGESCPAGCGAFYLNTEQRVYTLAAPTQDDWVPALCSLAFQYKQAGGEARRALEDSVDELDGDVPMTENNIYSSLSPGQFQVTVASSEASVRCCMFGSYLLCPEKESLRLLDMKTGHVAFFWPYCFLRRFGCVKEGITIEAGRRCQTGEGLFIFLSKQGQQIYRAIEEAIMHQSVQDLLSEATPLTVQRSNPSSPQHIARRKLALPALPGPKPTDLYATVKPLPKLTNIPPPPLPLLKYTLPPLALPESKLETYPKNEMKQSRLDLSDLELDRQSRDHNQDASDSQLYSTIKPSLHSRKNPTGGADRENPDISNPKISVSFKKILSDILLKDMSRTVPAPEPELCGETSGLSADSEYYEIQ